MNSPYCELIEDGLTLGKMEQHIAAARRHLGSADASLTITAIPGKKHSFQIWAEPVQQRGNDAR